MEIASFGVEEWLNEYETKATYDLSQSTVASLTIEEVIGLDGTKPHDFFERLYQKKLNYGDIEGSTEFKRLVASLYKNVDENNILQTNGATGGNLLAVLALVNSGDHVLTTQPIYQQLSDLPKAVGADVEMVELLEKNDWRVPIDSLIQKIRLNTKLITLNCAHNPTGSLVPKEEMLRLIEAARKVGAYILVDEVYHPFDEAKYIPIVDLYERGISVNSLSKTYSTPGLRIGWTASSTEVSNLFRKYRDYTMISAGVLNDALAIQVLKNRDKILKRNVSLLKKNLEILERWMEKEASVSLSLPHLVSTSCIKIDVELSMKDFCIQLLEKEGVLLVPGSAFNLEGYVRLGYGCPTEILEEGLRRISCFLRTIDSKEK